MEDRDDSELIEDDQQLVENEEQKKARLKSSEAGILEKIILKDFMCHKLLEVPFGPNINFIIGENGSGKSAILVGLAVCLGAKTTFTNRGSKIGDLVRSGASSAVVTVHIRNRGSEAFRHEDFGDTIVVERRLAHAGGSQYRLKNASGKEISKNRRDLTSMLDHFNIQVDNPCAVLMQDTSRQFLTESSSKDKYKFFMTGTQLEQLKRDMMFIKDALEQMSAAHEAKKKELPKLQGKVEDLTEELESLQNIDQLQQDISALRTTLAWAHVHADEVKLEAVEKELKAVSNELHKQRAALEMKENLLKSEREQNQSAKQDELNKLRKEVEVVRKKKSEAEQKLQSHRREQTKRTQRAKDLEKRIGLHRGRITRIEEEQKKQRDGDTSARKREKDKRLAEKKEKEELLAQKREAMQEVQANLDQLSRDIGEIEKASEDARKAEADLRRERDKAAQRINQLQLAQQNQMAKYGATTPQLLDLISKEKRWHKPPVGPVGVFIRLTEPKWANAVESQLKHQLRSYMVHDEHDRLLLRDIITKGRLEPVPMIVQAFSDHRYDIPPQQQPPPEVTTILRVLEVSSPWVCNGIIDQSSIERVALVRTSEESERLYNKFPKVIQSCVQEDGTTFRLRKGSMAREGNDYKASLLAGDPKEELERIKRALPELEQKLAEQKEKQQQLNHDFTQCRREKDKKQKELPKLQAELNNIESDISSLKLELDNEDARPAQTFDSNELMNKLKQEMHDHETELEKVQAEENKAQKEVAPIDSAVKEAEEQLREVEEKIENLQEEFVGIGATINKLLADTDTLKEKVAQSSAKVDSLTKSSKDLGTSINENSKRASVLGPRPERSNEPVGQLQNELKGKTRTLENEQRDKRPLEQVRAEFAAASSKFNALNQELKDLWTLIKELQAAGTDRHTRWRHWRKDISSRTRKYFNAFLSQKGHAGSISFDHEEASLDVQVQLNLLKSTEQHDTKSLSGGEKSYATVALLLAIWETMDTPFRAMDEFDVFMDAVRRTITIELIIKTAQQYRNRQFIFITPQDPSAISAIATKEVRVHKLHPPDRSQKGSQRTLNLGSQASQASQ